MFFKHFSREGLCKWISNVVLRSCLCDDHISSLHNLPYEMIFALNMFSSLMASWFFRICNCSTIITIKSCRCIFGTTSKSIKNFLSHTDSFVASQAATYSASMVESAMQPCFMLLHIIAPLFRVKIDSDVDFLESISV